MNKDAPRNNTEKRRMLRMAFFPIAILCIYGGLFFITPDKVSLALRISEKIFISLIFPMVVVFILMLLLNLFLKPAHIVKFLGKRAGIKTITLTVTAGIISMGPIYAWYPLMKDLREKGVRNALIAIFLGNRAVKPFLLPIMIYYFGWIYTLILTILTIAGSIAVGYATDIFLNGKGTN